MTATPTVLARHGFISHWKTPERECFSKECIGGAYLFVTFNNADGSVYRAGISTAEGVIVPIRKDAHVSDIVAAQKIFT